MSSIKIVDLNKDRPRIIIGKRKYELEEIDETHYSVLVSPKTLMKYKFEDLPYPETGRGDIIIEYLPFSKKKSEYLYEAKGLKFFNEASIWRNRERGYVYLEHILYPAKYAFKAWIPLDLFLYIIVKTAKDLGFNVETNRDETTIIIEIEKSYPLDTPIRIALLEIKELDQVLDKKIKKITSKLSTTALKLVSKELKFPINELEAILGKPEEKLSTLP
ncbi:MAG: hypothetical protein J7J82_07805 [Staphylothermus sp.]|nr:hypothetical protein [Staphylothermus sp.]